MDLETRVFRYLLSDLIYSEGFDALPLFVREHVYAKLATSPDFAREVTASQGEARL